MNISLRVLVLAALQGLAVPAALAAKTPAAPAKPAAAKAAAAKAAAPTAAATAPAAVAELELVHSLGADQGAQLAKLVERFNAASRDAKIVIRERAWNDGALPHLMILGEQDVAEMLAAPQPRFRPLHQVMKEAGEKFDALRPPAMMTPTPLDSANRLNALPVALSTPVMYYNKQALRDAGVDADAPPKTWQALQQVLGKLVANGVECPYTSARPASILVENTSAWHNEPVVADGRKGLAINGMLEVKHVAMLSSWYKARYLHLFGRGDEATERFADGRCAVLTAPSHEWPRLQRTAAFEVGVATLPYHEEYYGAPQNTLADGPAMWIGAGKKPAEYKAIAKFVSLWLSAESQVEWQKNAGYLPLNRAGLLASESTLLGSELAGIRVGVRQLGNKPATAVSRATTYPQRADVRRIVEEELEEVWAERKPSKLALDNAVERSRSVR